MGLAAAKNREQRDVVRSIGLQPVRALALTLLAACGATEPRPAEAVRFEIAGRAHAVERAVVVSRDNANESYSAYLWVPSAPHPDSPLHEAALILGTKRFAPAGLSLGAGSSQTIYTFRVDRAEASELAGALGVAVRERHHPGHEFACAFEVAGPVTAGSASVPVRFVLRNVGARPIQFAVGGMASSPGRDDRFHFRADPAGVQPVVIESGPVFGGLGTWVRLEPGAEHRADLDLARWFRFDAPGTYAVRGEFELELYPGDARLSDAWAELAGLRWDASIAADFAVVVAESSPAGR